MQFITIIYEYISYFLLAYFIKNNNHQIPDNLPNFIKTWLGVISTESKSKENKYYLKRHKKEAITYFIVIIICILGLLYH